MAKAWLQSTQMGSRVSTCSRNLRCGAVLYTLLSVRLALASRRCAWHLLPSVVGYMVGHPWIEQTRIGYSVSSPTWSLGLSSHAPSSSQHVVVGRVSVRPIAYPLLLLWSRNTCSPVTRLGVRGYSSLVSSQIWIGSPVNNGASG